MLEQEAFVGLQRAADLLLRELAETLKPYALSTPHYNVLRILRGAQPEALSCGEISERLISQAPDVTRLLDRLESAGWVRRSRQGEDRRVVRARITHKGLNLLQLLDLPVRRLHERQFGRMEGSEVKQFVSLLRRLLG